MVRTQGQTAEVVILHWSGSRSVPDCVTLFDSPFFHESHAGDVRVLFDWRSLAAWTSEDWLAIDTSQWKAIAHPLSRVALVHHAHWNRQAAIFAAILRREGVQVRSWKPEQIDTAVAWLTADNQ